MLKSPVLIMKLTDGYWDLQYDDPSERLAHDDLFICASSVVEFGIQEGDRVQFLVSEEEFDESIRVEFEGLERSNQNYYFWLDKERFHYIYKNLDKWLQEKFGKREQLVLYVTIEVLN